MLISPSKNRRVFCFLFAIKCKIPIIVFKGVWCVPGYITIMVIPLRRTLVLFVSASANTLICLLFQRNNWYKFYGKILRGKDYA